MTETNQMGNSSQSGVSAGHEGLILQRGGEELLLEKVSDRFTTRLRQPEDLETVRARLQPQSVRPVAQGQLIEWTVPPQRLEEILAAARQLAEVIFASHVYRLAVSLQTWVYLTEQLTIQFDLGAAAQGQDATLLEERSLAIASQFGLIRSRPLEGIPNTYIFEVSPTATENPIKIANRLMRLPEVLTAEPNVVVQIDTLYRPSDNLYPKQWHLFHSGSGGGLAPSSHIDIEPAWNLTRGSRSVVIAISDDGFDLEHPDLQGLGKLVGPADLKDRDSAPLPITADENHGTSVAGLAIGEENGSGIVGVAPGCSFMPIRTTGFLDDESIERLFDGAVERGADVISCSWSPASVYYSLSLRQQAALNRAATKGRGGKGCVILFSAGNANRPVSGTVNERNWPNNVVQGQTKWLSGFAVHPDVIAVSASTSLGQKAAYSNWGEHIAIAAPSNNAPPNMALPRVGAVATGPTIQKSLPGLGMVTSDRIQGAGYSSDSYTNSFGGTSSACPVAAGVAGLILSANPNLTAREVREILQSTADKVVDANPDPQLGLHYGSYDKNGHSLWFGYGKVNAFKAVQEARRRLYLGRSVQRVVRSQSTSAVAIADANPAGTSSSIRITDQGQVQDIQVRVEIDHEFLGDIDVSVVAPDGERVLLQGRTLGNQTQLRQTYTLATTPALTRLLRRTAAGNWQLRAVDNAPGATGQILQWELILGI
ncbi:MAG: S8 family serine peptidase [Cyanobacteria bacterium Co-bin8]|nr:S8 family serine peptidase [Cyanobacteria bacterium Co-bin8]